MAKLVKYREHDISHDRLHLNYHSLKDCRSTIDLLINKYGEDATLEVEHYEVGGITFNICYNEEETDEEYERRLNLEKQNKELKKASELMELNRLAEKFNKKIVDND